MAKSKRNKLHQPINQSNTQNPAEITDEEISNIRIKKLNVQFRTKAQEELWEIIGNKEVTICAGAAGTGKSHISILRSLDLMQKFPEKYKKIIITTPIVEADGEKMGFLPGTVEEKMAPYTYSSLYIFKKILGEQKVQRMIERGHIETMALAFLRGVNIDNSILICEEAQNLTKKTAKTLLTRIGENSKFILNGDFTQSDRVKNEKESGLFFAMERLKDIPQIGVFEFSDNDIVRNPVISLILKRFNGDV
jgi:phosphate starvation-inducible protein PhoH and related proteins